MERIAGATGSTVELGVRNRASRRRLRVARSFALLLLLSVAFVATVVWQRNRVRLAQATDQFEEQVAGLVEALERTGALPLSFPPRRPEKAAPTNFNYIEADTVRRLRDSEQPYIIAYSNRVRSVFGADLFLVAVKEGPRIRVERMEIDRFTAMFAAQTSPSESSGTPQPETGTQPN